MSERLDGVLDRATMDALFDSIGGDPDFLGELIDTYVGDAPEQLEALRAALATGAVAELVRPAHTLKSSSASLGALDLAERCRQLEASAKAGQSEAASEAIDAIASELERVMQALEATKRSYRS
jgi:HPt (histidine-containing phosphotransfer) domain-containing protein